MSSYVFGISSERRHGFEVLGSGLRADGRSCDEIASAAESSQFELFNKMASRWESRIASDVAPPLDDIEFRGTTNDYQLGEIKCGLLGYDLLELNRCFGIAFLALTILDRKFL